MKHNPTVETGATAPNRSLRLAVIILSLIGLVVALYLTYIKFAPGALLCTGVGGCDKVNASPYSWLFGIPVAVYGVLTYLAILGTVFLETRVGFFADWGRTVAFALALIGTLYSAYLTYLEIYVIHAICPYCVTSAVVITLICVLAGIRLFREQLR